MFWGRADTDYQFAERLLVRPLLDYHVEVNGFFYSVRQGLIRERVDVRAITRTIVLFHRGLRVAAHKRRYSGRRHDLEPSCSWSVDPAAVNSMSNGHYQRMVVASPVRRARRRFSVGASPTQHPLQPEATGAGMEATKCLKPLDSGRDLVFASSKTGTARSTFNDVGRMIDVHGDTRLRVSTR